MAGTLTIGTLSDGTNSTSSTNCIQGSAKAWVNFNGTTSPGTIRASYNVGSVTKNGTGDYTVNFTNAFPDANYCACIGSNRILGTYNWTTLNEEGTRSATAFQVKSNQNGTLLDVSFANITFFR